MSKKSGFKLFSKNFLLLVQFILSCALLLYVYFCHLLTNQHMIFLSCGVLAPFLFVMLLMNSGMRDVKEKGSRKKLIYGKIICVLLSGILVLVSILTVRGNLFFETIANQNMQSRLIKLYVPMNSDYQTIDKFGKDLEDNVIGYTKEKGDEDILKAAKDLEDKYGTKVTLEEYPSYAALGDAIYDDVIDGIFVDQAFVPLLELHHEQLAVNLLPLFDYVSQHTLELDEEDPELDFINTPFAIYLTGVDTYSDISTVTKTDTNMLVYVSPKHHQILIVSIPREIEVKLHRNGKLDKIEDASMYGIDESIHTLEDLFNTHILYYAKTNFRGMTNIVDSLGGIEIKSDVKFVTTHGNYKIKKGYNKLNGDQTLCYLREKDHLPRNDYDRGRNQQKVLKELMNKLLSPLNIRNFDDILISVEGSLETNLSTEHIKELIHKQMDEMDTWNIYNVQLSGKSYDVKDTYTYKKNTIRVIKPNTEKLNRIKAVIHKVEKNKKISKEDIIDLE